MGRRRGSRPMFVIGDFVFAKVYGYRAWPARILGRYGTLSKLKYRVFFYGSCNTAKVSPSHIFDFKKSWQTLGALPSRNNVRNAEFRSAMAHVRRAFAKPQDDFVYYQVLARTEPEGESVVAYEVIAPSTEEETDSEEEDYEDSRAAESLENRAAKVKELKIEAQGSRESDSEEMREEPQPAKKSKKSMPLLDDLDELDAELISAPELKQDDENIFSTDSDSDDEFVGNPIVGNSRLKDLEQQDTAETISSEEMQEEPQPAKKSKKSMPLLDAPDHAELISAPELKQNDENIFSTDSDSDDEFVGNPIVGNSRLKDLEQQDTAETISSGISRILEEQLENLGEGEDSELEETEDGGNEGFENDQPMNLSLHDIAADEQEVNLAFHGLNRFGSE